MGTDVVTKEQMKHLLDAWYHSMLKQDVVKAKALNEEIESKVIYIKENQYATFYHALLNFRYHVLIDSLSITKNSFDEIDALIIPDDALLTHYYHLFKGIHAMYISNYLKSQNHFEEAGKLLKHVTPSLEHAEFNYRFAYLSYQSYKPLMAIDQVRLAKEEYEKHPGYEVCIALCENIFAMACIDLKQYEQAEEKFNLALDVFQKIDNERFIAMVRHNLAWLYASQNLSSLAIRHLLEVVKSNPKHFKAIFVLAREYYKIGEIHTTAELIEKGLDICNKLQNKEFQHRFVILKEMNQKKSSLLLESTVLDGISYFEKEGLLDCVQEYTEILALQFYKEENHVKASEYFYINNQAQKNHLEKGALK
ncbi:response regulator aspartate phosphatase [Bacillus mycoides]